MWSETIVTLPLSPMAWQGPEWVRSDIAGTHRDALRGLVCTGPLILSSEERVPDKESMEDTSHQAAQELGLGITSIQTDVPASAQIDHSLLVTTLSISVQYLQFRKHSSERTEEVNLVLVSIY